MKIVFKWRFTFKVFSRADLEGDKCEIKIKFIFSRFPVNLDVVTAHNFDAVLAQKYFIICVPTVYGRLFPRLISCPGQKVDIVRQ